MQPQDNAMACDFLGEKKVGTGLYFLPFKAIQTIIKSVWYLVESESKRINKSIHFIFFCFTTFPKLFWNWGCFYFKALDVSPVPVYQQPLKSMDRLCRYFKGTATIL